MRPHCLPCDSCRQFLNLTAELLKVSVLNCTSLISHLDQLETCRVRCPSWLCLLWDWLVCVCASSKEVASPGPGAEPCGPHTETALGPGSARDGSSCQPTWPVPAVCVFCLSSCGLLISGSPFPLSIPFLVSLLLIILCMLLILLPLQVIRSCHRDFSCSLSREVLGSVLDLSEPSAQRLAAGPGIAGAGSATVCPERIRAEQPQH